MGGNKAAHKALDLEFVEFELKGARHQGRCVNPLEGLEGKRSIPKGTRLARQIALDGAYTNTFFEPK